MRRGGSVSFQGPGSPGRGGGSSGATPRACRRLIPPPAGGDRPAASPAAVFLLPWRGLGRETKIQDAVSWDSGQWVPVHPGPRGTFRSSLARCSVCPLAIRRIAGGGSTGVSVERRRLTRGPRPRLPVASLRAPLWPCFRCRSRGRPAVCICPPLSSLARCPLQVAFRFKDAGLSALALLTGHGALLSDSNHRTTALEGLTSSRFQAPGSSVCAHPDDAMSRAEGWGRGGRWAGGLRATQRGWAWAMPL